MPGLDLGCGGFGVEWQWKTDRTITATLNYFEIDEAPVTRDVIGGLGVINGHYSDRGTINLRVAMSLGPDRGQDVLAVVFPLALVGAITPFPM
jgi:hypothetical protein